jgi:DNA-binding transcriptional regulator YiaG
MAASKAQELARLRRRLACGEARELRRQARMSVGEVSTLLNVSPSAVWYWENGRRVPRGERALVYARLLDDLANVVRP